MSHQTDLRTDEFIEGTTPELTYTLKDEKGDIITIALDSQSASIYDPATGTVVPTWTDKDINNANGNVITEGVCVWDLPASATAKINDSEKEDHTIAVKGTYDTDKVVKHFIRFQVYRQVVGG